MREVRMNGNKGNLPGVLVRAKDFWGGGNDAIMAAMKQSTINFLTRRNPHTLRRAKAAQDVRGHYVRSCYGQRPDPSGVADDPRDGETSA